MRSMQVPDPAELGTPAGWRRAQQIRYHARHGEQRGVVAEVTVAMAQHLAYENDYERAEELLTEIHQGGQRYEALSRAGAAVQLAVIHDHTGRTESALRLLTEALPVLEQRQDKYAYALMRIGIVHAGTGDHDTALHWFARADEAAAGDAFLQAQVRDEMAMSESARGNFDRAARLHEAALPVFRAAEAHPAVVMNLAAQARLAARRNEPADAHRKAVAAAEIAVTTGMLRHAAALFLDAGHWAEQVRDLRAAEQALRRSLEIGGAVDGFPAARAHYHLGIVYARMGTIDPAIYHVRELVRLQPEAAFTNWLEALLLNRQELDGSSQ